MATSLGYQQRIPNRWEDYRGMNTWIDKTRFLPFKCPLKKEMQQNLDDNKQFTLTTLISLLESVDKELGIIIDLTNTDRYYKKNDVIEASIDYVKIKVIGHDTIPSEESYKNFVRVVQNFISDNEDNEKLIGVHCTHGINRTGYFIVRYMIEYMNWEPKKAIASFNSARGYSMYKFTEDLLNRRSL